MAYWKASIKTINELKTSHKKGYLSYNAFEWLVSGFCLFGWEYNYLESYEYYSINKDESVDTSNSNGKWEY